MNTIKVNNFIILILYIILGLVSLAHLSIILLDIIRLFKEGLKFIAEVDCVCCCDKNQWIYRSATNYFLYKLIFLILFIFSIYLNIRAVIFKKWINFLVAVIFTAMSSFLFWWLVQLESRV